MKKPASGLGSILRMWFLLFFGYLTLKVIFNLLFYRWIDLRRIALLELLVIPLGQSILFWIVTRVRKKTPKQDQPV
jgi:hypothetical protein